MCTPTIRANAGEYKPGGFSGQLFICRVEGGNLFTAPVRDNTEGEATGDRTKHEENSRMARQQRSRNGR
jgi:hypothetical protein